MASAPSAHRRGFLPHLADRELQHDRPVVGGETDVRAIDHRGGAHRPDLRDGHQELVEPHRVGLRPPGRRARVGHRDPGAVPLERRQRRAARGVVQVPAGDHARTGARAADAIGELPQARRLDGPARPVVGERRAEVRPDHHEGSARGPEVHLHAVARPDPAARRVPIVEVAHVRLDREPRQRGDVDPPGIEPLDEPRLRVPCAGREAPQDVGVLDLLQQDDVGVHPEEHGRDRVEPGLDLRVRRDGVVIAGRGEAIHLVEEIVDVPGRHADRVRAADHRRIRTERGRAAGEREEDGGGAHPGAR